MTRDPSTVPVHLYQWDTEGRLTEVYTPPPRTPPPQNQLIATIVYNALGQAVERTGTAGGGYRQENLYDAFGKELGSYDGNANAWLEQVARR